MKWPSLSIIAGISLLVVCIFQVYDNQSYENESRKVSKMICDMVSLRAQAGSTRDVYDQIFAFLRKHASDPKAAVSIHSGGKVIGPTLLDSEHVAYFQSTCDVENAPDYKIIFAFAKRPLIGLALAEKFCGTFLFFLTGFGLINCLFRRVRRFWFEQILIQLSHELGLSLNESMKFQGAISKRVSKLFTLPLMSLKSGIEKLKSSLELKQSELVAARLQVMSQVEDRRRTDAFEDRVRLVRHDLKSPLSALKIASRQDTAQLETLTSIIMSVEKIVGDLDQHQIANSPQDLRSTSLEIAEVAIQEVIDAKRVSLKSAQIEISFKYDRSRLTPIYVHPVYFRRVIANLVQNAIEASNKGPGKLDLQLIRKESTFEIQIKDDGRGIGKDDISTIFENLITIDKPGGSGLGLYFVRNCVQAWNGSITVDSVPACGAQFTITLPIAAMSAQFRSDSPGAGKLVVLDDEFEEYKSVWESYGSQVKFFNSPHSFMDWIEADAVADDLTFIIDVHLRDSIDGLDVARSMDSGVKIFFSTSDYLNPEMIELSANRKIPILPKALLFCAN